jgi:RNA polymerase sigma-70 factor (ECF subfamily)
VSDEREQHFRAFVQARYDALVRTGYLLTGDHGHAEDLVQSALVRSYASWARTADPHHAEAYVRTVMVRLASRQRRRPWRTEIVTDHVPDLGADWTQGRVDALALRTELLALPVNQRAVIVLRYYEQLSEAETAAALNCSVGTVKSRTSRALAVLRTRTSTPSTSMTRGQLR